MPHPPDTPAEDRITPDRHVGYVDSWHEHVTVFRELVAEIFAEGALRKSFVLPDHSLEDDFSVRQYQEVVCLAPDQFDQHSL
jgi:hypothetical protein